MAALRVEHLSVRYGARRALHEVDLTIEEGQVVALAGPNGSGKTTLIRAILGFIEVSGGTVELTGTPASELSVRERARRVAWVPQDESPRDNARLIDYVLYGRYAHQGLLEGESVEDRRLALRILGEVGLADRAADGILTISGGERQRAVLARALAQEAPVLLLDEPTSHLDIAHQLDILGRLRDLARGHRTTVLAALHDLNLAARFADRIVVLSRGQVVADGDPRTILSGELLRRVWGVAAELRHDPRTGTPFLIPYPLPVEASAPVRGTPAVHVVGGGGSATPYLRALTEAGFLVTLGVVHLFDTDSETAEALGLSVAEEVPFAPIGEEARTRNRGLLGAASAIVVAPFVVGPSNLANLEDIAPFVGRVPVWLVDLPTIAERDYTRGPAQVLYADLVARGAKLLSGVDAALAEVRALAATRAGRAPSRPAPVEPSS